MAMRGTTPLMIATAALLLAGCTSNWDMQGVDPKDYYALHPIKNKVEMQSESHVVHYAPSQLKLSGDEIGRLQAAFRDASPLATDAIHIQLSDADMHNDARKDALVRTLRSLGYVTDNLQFQPSATLARDDIQIDVTYAHVVSPDCPDWRRSSVTSYSNTYQGNFECANETNLGLMVANPRDLAKGSGAPAPDAARDAKVIEDYRSGKDFGPPAGSSGSDASGGASSSVASGVSGLTGGQ